jgi:FkbM family methyltransferase
MSIFVKGGAIMSAYSPEQLVKYELSFKGSPLSMVGRKSVKSDHDILSVIFNGEMFSTTRMPQNTSVVNYHDSLIKNGLQPTLIDAGANIGAASMYFNKIYAGLKTIAIEPDSGNAFMARTNLAGIHANLLEGALASESGTLYINDVDFEPISYRVGTVGNKPVRAFSIPEILTDLQKTEIPFILKIDIEGGEDSLFSGETDWINKFPVIIIELHDWMIPYGCVSMNFFRALTKYNFDIVNFGENTFCFNKSILSEFQNLSEQSRAI